MEAAVFQRYLEAQRLLSWEEARGLLPEGIMLTEEDWLLGVFDAVGEMMRWGVTGMATRGGVPGGKVSMEKGEGGEEGESMEVDGEEGGGRDMVTDMRELRSLLEGVEVRRSGMGGSVPKKMDVMKTCVEKIENAVYGMMVRGKERPEGWVPEGRDTEMRAVESY